jgi:hypothetical protein
MKKMFEYSYYILYMLLLGCASPQGTSTSSSSTVSATKYSEDLSFLRPKFEETANTTSNPQETNNRPTTTAEPVLTINKKLDAILDTIDQANLNRRFVEGYTIQVYSGQKREDALNTKRHLDSVVPELRSELQYQQPNFRVKAGRYFNRLDAQEDFAAVRRYFPNAIITPEKISVN